MALLNSEKAPRRKKVILERNPCVYVNGLAQVMHVYALPFFYDECGEIERDGQFDNALTNIFTRVNLDRFGVRVSGSLDYQRVDLAAGFPAINPKAKLCALLMVSQPEEYNGGKFRSEKINRGAMLFFDPSKPPEITDVTFGKCKVFFITATYIYNSKKEDYETDLETS